MCSLFILFALATASLLFEFVLAKAVFAHYMVGAFIICFQVENGMMTCS